MDLDKFEVGGEGGPNVTLRNREELPLYKERGPYLCYPQYRCNPRCHNLWWQVEVGVVRQGEGEPSQLGEEEEGVVVEMLDNHVCYGHG